MRKSQFIYRNGIPATVTRLDGTSYNTHVQYYRQSRSSQFSEAFTFSTNYMRDGVFSPNDDVQNGYIVNLTGLNERAFIAGRSTEMAYGSAVSISTEMLIINYTIQLQRLTRTYDALKHPTGETWSTIGSYDSLVDFRNGGVHYQGELLTPTTQMTVLVQNTVPVQVMDRLVINNVNYQVDALDFTTSSGLVFVNVTRDMRS